MHACVHTNTHTHAQTHKHVYTSTPTNTSTHKHTHALSHTHTNTYTHTHKHIYIHSHSHALTHTHMHSHTHTYARTHARMHTRTHTLSKERKKPAPYLFGQLFLTQLVQSVELSGQDDVVNETHRGQFHTDDDLSVRHHHGHRAEVDLEVFWQLLTPSIARVLWKTSPVITCCNMILLMVCVLQWVWEGVSMHMCV